MAVPALSSAPEHDTRGRIVTTAERFFREIGYQKTTVADIARALKMSPANVYRFFNSKKAINEAVAERLMRQVEGAVAAIASTPGPVAQRLVAMIETMHRLNAALYTDDLRMHEMVERALSESWDVVHGHLERKSAIFEAVVREGIASGEFAPADPVVAAGCLQVGLLRFFHPGMIVQCAREPGPTLAELTDFLITALRRGSCVDKPGARADTATSAAAATQR